MFQTDEEETQARRRRANVEIERMRDDGIRFVQMEIPDNNGTLRGKICGLNKGLAAAGTTISTLTLAFRSGDKMVMTPFSNIENGFPKMIAVPDYDTLATWPWRDDMAAVLCDFYLEDGTPCELDARHLLKRIITEYTKLGLEPRIALEFELYLFEADASAIREKRYSDLRPWGVGWDAYSLARYPAHEFEHFAKEFMSRMEAMGIEVEAFHTEYGDGMYEFTVTHKPALQAADEGVRSKLYMKQFCHESGMVPSFMAAIQPDAADSMTGFHHNCSLWKDGANAFWDSENQSLSTVGRHFAGGVLATMVDFHLLFRPWVNSYQRMDPEKWCPENASWGLDNHTAALRVVHGSSPEKNTRLEHRVSATDTNPYLSIAAILAGGLHGIRNEIEPPEYVSGNASENKQAAPLQKSLNDSIQSFRASDIAKEMFGNQFVEHISIIKQEEWDDFSEWMQKSNHDQSTGEVSPWEIERYFLWV